MEQQDILQINSWDTGATRYFTNQFLGYWSNKIFYKSTSGIMEQQDIL